MLWLICVIGQINLCCWKDSWKSQLSESIQEISVSLLQNNVRAYYCGRILIGNSVSSSNPKYTDLFRLLFHHKSSRENDSDLCVTHWQQYDQYWCIIFIQLRFRRGVQFSLRHRCALKADITRKETAKTRHKAKQSFDQRARKQNLYRTFHSSGDTMRFTEKQHYRKEERNPHYYYYFTTWETHNKLQTKHWDISTLKSWFSECFSKHFPVLTSCRYRVKIVFTTWWKVSPIFTLRSV